MVAFTHQLFSPEPFSTAIEIVSKFLPKKNRGQNARQTQSHWLVALLSRDDWVFTPSLVKSRFFMLYCKKQTNIFYYVASQASERCIVQKATMSPVFFTATVTSVFFTLYCKKQQHRVYFIRCTALSNGNDCIVLHNATTMIVSYGMIMAIIVRTQLTTVAICKQSIARDATT